MVPRGSSSSARPRLTLMPPTIARISKNTNYWRPSAGGNDRQLASATECRPLLAVRRVNTPVVTVLSRDLCRLGLLCSPSSAKVYRLERSISRGEDGLGDLRSRGNDSCGCVGGEDNDMCRRLPRAGLLLTAEHCSHALHPKSYRNLVQVRSLSTSSLIFTS